jgi:hypothetical protein
MEAIEEFGDRCSFDNPLQTNRALTMRRSNTLAFTFCLTISCLQAQIGPPIEWQRCIGGSWIDFGYYAQQTTSGGYIVAGGSSSSDGDITCQLGPSGSGDGIAAMLDSVGNINWLNCCGVASPIFEEAIAALEYANGESFFLGNFSGPGRFELDGSPSVNSSPTVGRQGIVALDSNIVVVDLMGDIRKYSPNGAPIWSQPNDMFCIRATDDGGFISVGTLNEVAFPNYGDGRITKLNSLGNAEWVQDMAGAYSENFKSVDVTADGGYVVCGLTRDPNVPGFHGDADTWVLKYDAMGVLLWQRVYGGSSQELANSIVSTSDGGMVVVGNTMSNDGDVVGFHGGEDIWVIKLDSVGDLQWQRCLGGTSTEWGLWVDLTDDDGYVISGWSQSNDGDVVGAHGQADIWVVKLQSEFTDSDGDGTPDWADLCANGPEPGTPCDDGNALTALDTISASCQCIGQADSDGDGVPDVSDVCPGSPDPGMACDDGDPFTALDTVNANCQCAGQPDDDGDGVPNTDDVCPGGPDPGQSCDDGSTFTADDSVNASCQCIGLPDNDQDGVADINDPCPLQAGLIPGQSCDDGNANTENDVVVAFGINCLCQGELSTGLSSAPSSSFRIVPNPSSGFITITVPSVSASTVVIIHDAYGRVLLNENLTSTNQVLDLTGLAKGLYTASVLSENGVATQRIVLE